MEMVLNWYNEFEELIETTMEPISSYDFLVIAYKTNVFLNKRKGVC